MQGNCQRDNCPWWGLSRGAIILGGNCLEAIAFGGNCPGGSCCKGNFPGGNCPRTTWEIHLCPLVYILKPYWSHLQVLPIWIKQPKYGISGKHTEQVGCLQKRLSHDVSDNLLVLKTLYHYTTMPMPMCSHGGTFPCWLNYVLVPHIQMDLESVSSVKRELWKQTGGMHCLKQTWQTCLGINCIGLY